MEKSMLKKVLKKIKKIYIKFVAICFPKYLSKKIYMKTQHKRLDLKNPKEFNEKLMYLKLNDYKNNQLVIDCADKFKVRDYVKKCGLENILNELYFSYNSPEEINWEELPNQFVLKWNYGSGYNIICRDKIKLNKSEVLKQMSIWGKQKFGYNTAELHYTKIKPKIICEKLINTPNGEPPKDYKLYCFNGNVKVILVCTERDKSVKLNFFDTKWKQLQDIVEEQYSSEKMIEKPKNLEQMIKYAEILGKNFKFVRVDFYNDNGKIIFGEMTFTPAACISPKYSENGSRKLGDYLTI